MVHHYKNKVNMKFFSTAHNLYDATLPLFYFSKFLGYWPSKQRVLYIWYSNALFHFPEIINWSFLYSQRSKNAFTFVSIIHFFLMLALNAYFLYTTIDPKPYLGVTNSKILNTGLWVQRLYSMLLSISLMLYAVWKRETLWAILELMFEIDCSFQHHFHIIFNYTGLKRLVK